MNFWETLGYWFRYGRAPVSKADPKVLMRFKGTEPKTRPLEPVTKQQWRRYKGEKERKKPSAFMNPKRRP